MVTERANRLLNKFGSSSTQTAGLTWECAAVTALRDSENRFDALFDQAAVGVVLSAPDGRWLRVNQKLCDILGYDESELVNLGSRPITHSEDVDSDLDLLARLKAGETPFYTEEKRFIHKDGSIAWVFTTVSLVRSADGDPDYFITIIENIWRRVRIREELRRNLVSRIKAGEELFPGIIAMRTPSSLR